MRRVRSTMRLGACMLFAACSAHAQVAADADSSASNPAAANAVDAIGPQLELSESTAASSAAAISPALWFTVCGGQLGADPVFDLRLAYFPTTWMGMEATLGHNPSSSLHAALHHVDAVACAPSWLRLRPYATAGLGTIQVFPGAALNAESVTKLTLDAGGGTTFSLRDDVALRLEARSFTVLDQQEAHRGAYQYWEWSGGIVFHRSWRNLGSETGAAP